MVLQANVQALFKLANSFGPAGIKFALDATEGAVRVATEAAAAKMRN